MSAASATTLATSPNQSATVATIEFSKVFRLKTNSKYRATYTSAAPPSTSTLMNSTRRTAAADGPVRAETSAPAAVCSTRSVKPQRGITA